MKVGELSKLEITSVTPLLLTGDRIGPVGVLLLLRSCKLISSFLSSYRMVVFLIFSGESQRSFFCSKLTLMTRLGSLFALPILGAERRWPRMCGGLQDSSSALRLLNRLWLVFLWLPPAYWFPFLKKMFWPSSKVTSMSSEVCVFDGDPILFLTSWVPKMLSFGFLLSVIYILSFRKSFFCYFIFSICRKLFDCPLWFGIKLSLYCNLYFISWLSYDGLRFAPKLVIILFFASDGTTV